MSGRSVRPARTIVPCAVVQGDAFELERIGDVPGDAVGARPALFREQQAAAERVEPLQVALPGDRVDLPRRGRGPRAG